MLLTNTVIIDKLEYFFGFSFLLVNSYSFFYFYFIIIIIFCPFAVSWATPAAYGGSQARGRIRPVAAGLHHSHSNTGSELHLWPTPQLTATRSLTHWARPGIKPASSCILVGFITAKPWWELPDQIFLNAIISKDVGHNSCVPQVERWKKLTLSRLAWI